ncbi:phospholipase A2 [Planobispora longispora]|uniref:phospholipase A2 n=1 Tax=Planobispora longispora TaxID=28887 RepID=UPI0019427DEF|nr:phospholipase A2 [Planobispora longispora]
MRRLAITTAVAVALLPLLSPATSASASASTAEEPDPVPVQQVGPGQYFSDTNTFKISETDVSAGLIGRKHGVIVVDGGLARPQSAPGSRPDLSVFGPGWQAEFLGGAISRKLEVQSGAILVTDLAEGETVRYGLRSSVSFPGGGGVQRYEAPDGSKVTETTRWDSAAGAMRTSISETIAMNLGDQQPEEGDDTFTDAGGAPLSSAALNLTYSWNRLDGLQSADAWRVTGLGNTAYGASSVGYDSQGRVSTIREPASGETPEALLTVHYATATTATATSFGDYAGRLKEITLTSGPTAPQTVARYGYDPSGLLRTMTNPSTDASPQATYAYDAIGRLTSINSRNQGGWELSFATGTAAPTVTSTDPGRPVPGSPLPDPAPDATGPAPGDFLPGDISGPQANPRACYYAATWLWYTRAECYAAWVAHYGWRKPAWKRLPTGYWVVGIKYDHCTWALDRPSGFDFRSACDMHDYGYGLIGNVYRHYIRWLDIGRKLDVDGLFYVTLRDYTCSAYSGSARRSLCRSYAYTYWKAVKARGNPKNGADKTPIDT